MDDNDYQQRWELIARVAVRRMSILEGVVEQLQAQLERERAARRIVDEALANALDTDDAYRRLQR